MVALYLFISMATIYAQTTALHTASAGGELKIVNAILEAGANIHAKDSYGATPLHWAAESGHVKVVKALLEAGSDIDARDNYGYTALYWAKREGRSAIEQVLVEAGADPTKATVGPTNRQYGYGCGDDWRDSRQNGRQSRRGRRRMMPSSSWN